MNALVTELRGTRYRLEPLRRAHVSDRYIGWLNDPEVNRYLEIRHQRQTVDSVTAFIDSFAGIVEKYAWAIVDGTGEGGMVGTITLYDIDRYHGSAYLGLMIGDRNHWGGGCSVEAMELVLAFAFDTVGLRRMNGACYASNRGMAFTFRKLGFTREGIMRQASRLGESQYVDAYWFGLLVDEWRAKRR